MAIDVLSVSSKGQVVLPATIRTKLSMIDRKQGHLSAAELNPFVRNLYLMEASASVEVCRDPDDNKFNSCAIDSRSYYIISGDNDLLVPEKYEGIEIITANDFCRRFLNDSDGQ